MGPVAGVPSTSTSSALVGVIPPAATTVVAGTVGSNALLADRYLGAFECPVTITSIADPTISTFYIPSPTFSRLVTSLPSFAFGLRRLGLDHSLPVGGSLTTMAVGALQAGVGSGVGVGDGEGASSSLVQRLDSGLPPCASGVELPCTMSGTEVRVTDKNKAATTNLPLTVAAPSHRDHPLHRHSHNNSNHTNATIHTDFASSHLSAPLHLPGVSVQYGEVDGLALGDPSARRKALAIFHRLEELEVTNEDCCQCAHAYIKYI